MNRAVDTYVESHGDGPPIILLHGFTGDTTTMHGLSNGLDGCGQRVLIDLIGHGKSQAPPWSSYEMDDAVAQIRSVLESLDDPPVLVGYSLGARVALAAAASDLNLRGLVTIGGRAGIADRDERLLRRAADKGLANEIEERGIEWFVDHWANQPFFASQQALGLDHLAAVRRQRLGNSAHALAASLRGMGPGAQEPLHDQLPEMNAPTLVMLGELDLRFRGFSEELLNGLPNAELSTVPVAGHAAHIEAPGEAARQIRAFLTRI